MHCCAKAGKEQDRYLHQNSRMKAAGYSGTPLPRKLGIKESMRILLLHAPDDYAALLGINITPQLVQQEEIPDFVHLFARNYQAFLDGMNIVLPYCRQQPRIVIWVSWYKKSSRLATDLSEDLIRQFALANDLVDVKVCAVDEHWSGLKLVVPLQKRG